jgi:hypothetical protein
MGRLIYLDDIRAPYDGWELVKTASECIEALKGGDVEYLSLDHDLGVHESSYFSQEHEFSAGQFWPGTGYDVCKWMAENNVWPSRSITLHTANPVGRINMRQLINRYKPEGLLVFG